MRQPRHAPCLRRMQIAVHNHSFYGERDNSFLSPFYTPGFPDQDEPGNTENEDSQFAEFLFSRKIIYLIKDASYGFRFHP